MKSIGIDRETIGWVVRDNELRWQCNTASWVVLFGGSSKYLDRCLDLQLDDPKGARLLAYHGEFGFNDFWCGIWIYDEESELCI